MPMVPELPIAMLACTRIGVAALGDLRRLLARRDHRPVQRRRGPADHHRRRRLPAGRPLTAQAQRRRWRWPRARPSNTSSWCDRCHTDVAMTDGRDLWWHDADGAGVARLPGRAHGHRAAAVPALHLGHDRQAQGHHAHHRGLPRPGGVHPQVRLRPAPRDRRLLVRGRHRLGHRAQLHRLRPALPTGATSRDVRGHARHAARSCAAVPPPAGTRTGCGTSSSATRSRSSTPRPPPSARS